jgi:isoamylase
VPMVLMGDEVRRTQGGNNNAYCQDNEIGWFDWTLLKKHADVHRFFKLLAAQRLRRGMGLERQRMSLNQLIREATKAWHGTQLNQPDWGDSSRSIALTVQAGAEKFLLHAIFNAYWEPLDFELPPLGEQNGSWRRWIDTAQPTPNDIVPWESAPALPELTYRSSPRSVVVLCAPGG